MHRSRGFRDSVSVYVVFQKRQIFNRGFPRQIHFFLHEAMISRCQRYKTCSVCTPRINKIAITLFNTAIMCLIVEWKLCGIICSLDLHCAICEFLFPCRATDGELQPFGRTHLSLRGCKPPQSPRSDVTENCTIHRFAALCVSL